jgi:hypothetical protein
VQITLTQFEAIDGHMAALLRAGPFETCADPRSYISTSNVLLDACVDAIGYEAVNAYADALECAADITTKALLDPSFVVDGPVECDCGAATNNGALICGSCAAEYRAELACGDDA